MEKPGVVAIEDGQQSGLMLQHIVKEDNEVNLFLGNGQFLYYVEDLDIVYFEIVLKLFFLGRAYLMGWDHILPSGDDEGQ